MFNRAPSDADHAGDPLQLVRVGRVQSVDRASARAVVAIGDPDGDEVETADIAWATLRAGETIAWSPPSVGEQVLLLCPEGDIAQAVALPGLYCAAFPQPGTEAREFLRFGDGAEIGYDPDAHHCDITLPAGATLAITADGGLTITGPVAITGDVTVTGDVVADGISLKNHKHGGVQAGAAKTGAPE